MRTLLLVILVALAHGCAARHAAWSEAGPPEAARRGLETTLAQPNVGAGLFAMDQDAGDDLGRLGEASGEPARDPAAPPEPATDRLLIHTGSLALAVADPEAAGRQARAFTEAMGGYVHLLTNEQVVLRIPADRFEDALAAATALGRVLRRELRVQDVTEEYQDLELELKNLRALSDRLVELLAQAEDVEAALAVEKELARVRTQIERLEGRRKYLSNQVAFATLHLTFQQVSEVPPQGTRLPFDWLQRLGLEQLLDLPGGVR